MSVSAKIGGLVHRTPAVVLALAVAFLLAIPTTALVVSAYTAIETHTLLTSGKTSSALISQGNAKVTKKLKIQADAIQAQDGRIEVLVSQLARQSAEIELVSKSTQELITSGKTEGAQQSRAAAAAVVRGNKILTQENSAISKEFDSIADDVTANRESGLTSRSITCALVLNAVPKITNSAVLSACAKAK